MGGYKSNIKTGSAKKVKFSYDKEADVLYSYIDKPRPAISREEADSILIRRDPVSNEIVGFTIIGYSILKKKGPVFVPHFEGIKLP